MTETESIPTLEMTGAATAELPPTLLAAFPLMRFRRIVVLLRGTESSASVGDLLG